MLVLESILSLLIQKQRTARKLYKKHWITFGLNLTSPEYDLNTELIGLERIENLDSIHGHG